MAPGLAEWVNGLLANQARDAGLDPVMAKVMQNYGYMIGYMEHPEVGAILREAAKHGWSKEILQGRLYQTAWWKTMSAGKRELEMLQRSDPAEYDARINAKATELQIMAQKGGAWFRNFEDVRTLAKQVLSDPSISPEQVQYMVFAQAKYQEGKQGGTLGAGMDGIKKRAADFFVPLSDKAAFDWSKRIQMGVDTPEGVDAYLRQQAKSRFSHLADDIDRGATTRELFDPYIQQTAQLLEISPEQVNLMEKRFRPMISTKDADSGKARSMTLSEAEEYVKRSQEYDTTKGAMNEAAKFAESLMQTFGKVK